MRKILIATLFLLLTVPVFAQGQQDQPYIGNNEFGFAFSTGLIMAEPQEFFMSQGFGINLIYHPVRFLSIEPSLLLTLSRQKDRDMSGDSDTDENLMLGAGLGLFYNHHLGSNLYLYVGPRAKYLREEYNSFDDSGSKTESRGYYWGINLTIGLKFLFNEHVGLFGDFGIGYLRHESTRTSFSSAGNMTSRYENEDDFFSAMSGLVGVCFYF